MIVLALNCGSSSLKYALFDDEDKLAGATLDNIGNGGLANHAVAVHAVFDDLARRGLARPDVVGHRLVHGGPVHLDPVLVDAAVRATLESVIAFAPLHLPIELDAIAAVRARFGDLAQVACFDTGFHRTLPEVAQRFALPRSLFDAGIRRYGFHGLSYEYVAATLPAKRQRRAVFAHLGNGASMVAVRDGRSVDTTMGLTPTGGLVMGTRSGDLDPGVLLYLLNHGNDARDLARLVDFEAGLLALSETTSDVKQLLERRASDRRAAHALDVFCYRAKQTIGAVAAVLGGIETLVFTGGIGEHAAEIRQDICRDLGYLGIALDGDTSIGACEVCVVRTDEERMIARHARALIGTA
jgi:acetate kinase